MGQMALRVRRNIENLKQIDIQKAPFNTKLERFTSREHREVTQEGSESPTMVNWNSRREREREARQNMMMKNISMHEAQPSAAFKSNSRRSWAIPSHYIGPGNYDCPYSLEKKSFNREYNYKPPNKIRGTYRTRSSLC
jgi:hypothetical protein